MQASAASSSRRNTPSSYPAASDTDDIPSISNGITNGTQGLPSTGWREPPLKAPAPSFTEYKGLERQGVLERMMPLGTYPTAKVNARKKGEPLRRTVQARNLEGMELDDSRATPDITERTESTPVADSTRASSIRAEEQNTMMTPNVEEPGERPFTPEQTQPPGPAQGSTSRKDTTPSITPAQRSLPPVPPLVPGSPFDIALKRATHRSHMATAQQVPWVNAYAHNDPEFDQILTAMSTIADPTNRPPELMRAYEKKVRKIKKEVKKAQRAFGSNQLSAIVQLSLPTSPQTSQNHLVSPSPKKKPNPSLSPATQQETTITSNKLPSSYSPAPQHPSPLKMTLNLNPPQTSSRKEKSAAMNGLPPIRTGSPLKSTENPSEPHSRRSSSSELSPVDENVVDAPPAFLKSARRGHKRKAADASLLNDDDHVQEAKRRHLQKDFDHVPVQESYERPHRDKPLRSPEPRPTLVEQSRQMRLRNMNESAHATNGLGSPVLNGSTNDMPRGPTPTALGRPPKNPPTSKKSAKVKVSPQKNKNGAVIAGVARPNNKRARSVGDDDNSEQSDNNDYCSACGGNGFMLCCDGCPRSYHFTCVDPPLDQNASFDDPWFCYDCKTRKAAPKKPENGLFSSLLQQVDKKSPESFKLPDDIRDFFEGVRTGDDGEYIEAVATKPNTRATRTGYDEVPDWTKLKDAKGNTILCYSCGKSSLDHRDIIPCDYCNLHWHLDCLSPPLANPPNRGLNSRTRPAWMCPNHVDHDLRYLDPVTRDGIDPGNVKAHRVRRPKNPRIVDVSMRRGFKNNGLIEVADETSDDSGFESEEDYDGIVYSVKPKGIILDFIDKVKRNNEIEYKQTLRRTAKLDQQSAQLKLEAERVKLENERMISDRLEGRSADDRQAALNLTQMRINHEGLNLSSDRLKNLAYVAEAEATTAERKANIEPSGQVNGHQSREERRAELLRQRERIDQELAGLD